MASLKGQRGSRSKSERKIKLSRRSSDKPAPEQPPPIVALGGSAGSVDALTEFFSVMPENSGLAFIVVLHFPPNHDSSIPEIIGRRSKLRILHAEHNQPIKPNHAYVIPPGSQITLLDSRLKVAALKAQRGVRKAVDMLFTSLAEQRGRRAAGVILSGADSDGAAGLKRISESGGLTVVQDPTEALHEIMPKAAIATGCVDAVLPLAEIPVRLLANFGKAACVRTSAPAVISWLEQTALTPQEEFLIRDVLACVSERTGQDVSYFRHGTVLRRVAWRMKSLGVENLARYLGFLRTDATEAQALARDLLISVTSFFRDPDSFRALERFIPDLFKGRGPDDFVRVWVPACATGEEAYSVAILLYEHARSLKQPPAIQVFGCDIDGDAIETARAGLYPKNIADVVNQQRLRRFFTSEPRGFRVRPELRQVVLFAVHDVVKDAAFARMDLVTCRNLLIYLNAEAQTQMLQAFHFALRRRGLLFLGAAETVGDKRALFEPLDVKHHIYRQRPTGVIASRVYANATALVQAMKAEGKAHGPRSLPTPPSMGPPAEEANDQHSPLTQLHLRLIERLAAASAVVNEEHQIVHLSEKMRPFIQFGSLPHLHLPRLVHPRLRGPLRCALDRAAQTQTQMVAPPVSIELEGTPCEVNITISPAGDIAPGFLLVVFDVIKPSGQVRLPIEPEPVARELEQQVENLRKELRKTQERSARSGAELQASNQELQAINQELRAATQELEISRQELQSINEELSAVNQELNINLDELGRSNTDLHNLINATAIPTVFLDEELRIMRFTPGASDFFRLIDSDVGRPLAHLRHDLEYPTLLEDVDTVLATTERIEREVHDRSGRWFLARLVPYRTQDQRIAGVVLAFLDITQRRRAEAELREKAKLARELEDMKQLQKISSLLIEDESGDGLYERMVDAAMVIMGAQFSSIQILDAERGELRLVAWRNFHPKSAEFWERVSVETGTTCGSALQHAERIVVPDVNAADFSIGSETMRHYRLSGIVAVQSTPLTTREGRVIGMISTHWRQRHEPDERDLAIFDVLARQTADVLERRRALETLRSSEAWLAGQKEAFQAAVYGAPLEESLGVLVRTAVKQMGEDVRCAFYIADRVGRELRHITGMPDSYAECVDGFKIGPDSLACGLAVYTGQPVVTPDVNQAPLWKPWLWLAEKYEYRGCWSFPIETSSAKIVGTCAMYFKSPREAMARDYEFAAVLTRAAAIIMSRNQEADERARAEVALRESESKLAIERADTQQLRRISSGLSKISDIPEPRPAE